MSTVEQRRNCNLQLRAIMYIRRLGYTRYTRITTK